MQSKATLVIVSENVDIIFANYLGSELTETSQLSNEIEVVSGRLTKQ